MMRTAAPWLSSLILHSLFLAGLVVLSRPPELPKTLPLDFRLVLQAVEEVTSVSDAAPPVAVPQPVKKVPKPVAEKKTLPVEPTPVPKVVEREPQPAPVVKEPELVEPPMLAPVPVEVSAAESEAAEVVRYAQTVFYIRGQVLDKLTYPAMARRMGWYGKLVLGFVLCDDGSVENLKVLESSGHKVLDRAALQAVAANAPFRGGYPRTEVKMPINFQLN